jgi:hypothetical protein
MVCLVLAARTDSITFFTGELHSKRIDRNKIVNVPAWIARKASTEDTEGWKLSSLLLQMLTYVLLRFSIPQVAAMVQKCID